MKNYKYLLLVSTCLLFNNNLSATELDLTFNPTHSPLGSNTTLYTHTSNVGLKPISNFVKLTAVCSVGSGGCGDLSFSMDNATLCRDEGYGISCPSGYVPDTSQKCTYNNSFYKCRPCSHSCSSGSLAYCNSNQLESGSFLNDCGETCYTCRTKTCEDGGYLASINSCQKASSINYAGNTCYSSVVSKTCADGGYSASISANQVGQLISYCGNTCYSGVKNPTCSEGGFQSSIPTNQSCTSTTYYGQTCYKDCYTPNCGAGGYNASTPANNICSSINYYGTTCYKDCYQPACSSGGYLAACPADQVGTAVSHYGRTCYKDCKVVDVACTYPYSKDITSCTSPNKLYTQATNPNCASCVNECVGYTTSPNCMDKSFMENNTGYGDEMHNQLDALGRPAMQSVESCSFDSNYKRCVNDQCSNVNNFVSIMKSEMKTTLCLLRSSGQYGQYDSLCSNGSFAGHQFIPSDYKIYVRLLNEKVCGVGADASISTCEGLMSAVKSSFYNGC